MQMRHFVWALLYFALVNAQELRCYDASAAEQCPYPNPFVNASYIGWENSAHSTAIANAFSAVSIDLLVDASGTTPHAFANECDFLPDGTYTRGDHILLEPDYGSNGCGASR